MAPSIPPPAPPVTGHLLYRVVEYSDASIANGQLCSTGNTLSPQQLRELMAAHVERWGKAITPFRSTSRSFLWALWEASRRDLELHIPAHKIEILIIDHRRPRPLVLHPLSEEPLINHHRFQNDNKLKGRVTHCREVLVQGGIPDANIIARVPWSMIRNRLPDFFDLGAELDKGYRYRYKDCVERCLEEGREETRDNIATFLDEVFRSEIASQISNNARVNEYVRDLERHLFSHLFMSGQAQGQRGGGADGLDALLTQMGGLAVRW
ncbi:hypothetical protein VNI00_016884 [Paramarasmius palmivorus]|uniref:DUF7587 domain-containing protein n=1 Tax=Paramarasmius palmivorus TaxID=297713 RepID=A0AAW0BB84_9AGAR